MILLALILVACTVNAGSKTSTPFGSPNMRSSLIPIMQNQTPDHLDLSQGSGSATPTSQSSQEACTSGNQISHATAQKKVQLALLLLQHHDKSNK